MSARSVALAEIRVEGHMRPVGKFYRLNSKTEYFIETSLI
jgi:hypothetical protein